MPELPEVETIVQDIRPDLVGRTIRRASLSHVDVLRGVTRPKLLAALKGAAIRSVTRRAKHAVIALGERRLVIQPGMTGSLTVRRDPLSRDEAKYAVLRAPLDSGRELVYQDVRRLGTLLLLNERLHEVNLGWHPRAEEVLWRPDLQEPKRSENGATNVRYRSGAKRGYLQQIEALIRQQLPSCAIRYAF